MILHVKRRYGRSVDREEGESQKEENENESSMSECRTVGSSKAGGRNGAVDGQGVNRNRWVLMSSNQRKRGNVTMSPSVIGEERRKSGSVREG